MEKIFDTYRRSKEATRILRVRGARRLFNFIRASLCAPRLGRAILRRRARGLPPALDAEAGFIVSFTTFPERIGKVWMVVDCIMRQKLRPAQIVLTLYSGEFPEREASLPENLTPYLKLGLKVDFVPENLRPHLKYHYAFKNEAAGARRPVITVDDDLFYAPDTTLRLMELHRSFPDAVASNICRRINGELYSGWEDVYFPEGPSGSLVALGFGGVLYPASFYASCPLLYDTDKVRELCLGADDLWLKHCETACGTAVVTGEFFAIPPVIPSSQKKTLSKDNVAGERNDIYWKKLKECTE